MDYFLKPVILWPAVRTDPKIQDPSWFLLKSTDPFLGVATEPNMIEGLN